MSRSGTWSSPNTIATRPGACTRSPGPRWTPAWGSSASRPSCRGSTATTTSMCSARSSAPSPRWRGRGDRTRAPRSRSSPITSVPAPSSPPKGWCPPTKAAVTCCAGSSGAPSGTARHSGSRGRSSISWWRPLPARWVRRIRSWSRHRGISSASCARRKSASPRPWNRGSRSWSVSSQGSAGR